ncbi:unnamed protein product [Heligmosomoides polygyrus]|uniref:BPTI/Kunitz inhibitor domain-containing protein n=1 Tax=Heligmosomoides polygyrus TaxID=6339 RepID=A0A3P8H6M5_HELPZ|nr:unnamed protein product [Heligmosomoides polygyrus]
MRSVFCSCGKSLQFSSFKDLDCPAHKTCALVSVQCDRDPCPAVAKCVTSPCDRINVVRDLYGNAFSCRTEGCPRGTCLAAIAEDVGVCCQRPETTTEMPAHLRARSNCALYRDAIEELHRRGVHELHQPACNQKTGLFVRIQCEASGTCWCADVDTGRPVLGTRRPNSVGQNLCEVNRKCVNQCSSSVCPYGPALDNEGCPFVDCRCYSPCDKVNCKGNEVCVLRVPQCSSKNCIAVPACENSPCSAGDRPVIDPRTKRQFYCKESGEICPTGFYCTGFDTDGTGLCCPGRGYVCSLRADRGPCSVTVPRYVYSPASQACSSFEYGGCAGNLNNFATKEHCESFCEGVTADFLSPYLDGTDVLTEAYELGFSLTGPQIPLATRRHAQLALAESLSRQFSLPSSSIEDVVILDDNTARFTVKDAHASRIAKSISDAFTLNGYNYRAEPHTWFAHQIAESSSSSAAKTVFWALLSAAVLFAGIVVIGLCSTCAYIFRSTFDKDDSTTERNNSPSEFISHSIFAGRQQQRRPQIRQDLLHFPSNATTRSVRSIPHLPSISIERSGSVYR